MDKTSKKIIRRLITIAALIVTAVILCLLKNCTSVCEFMTRTVSRAIVFITGHISSLIPISLYELLIIIGVLLLLALPVIAVEKIAHRKTKSLISFLLAVVVFLAALANVYILSATFAYNREELEISLYDKEKDGELSSDKIKAIAEAFVKDLNELAKGLDRDENGLPICPYTFKELNEKLQKEYERLDSDYFSAYTPNAKAIFNKTIMSEMRLGGVFFAPFGEPNINTIEKEYGYIVTMAHEMAHSKGVMREDDANLLSYYITLTSEDPFIRYAGYYEVYYRVVVAVSYAPDSYTDYVEIYNSVCSEVRTDESYEYSIWSKYYLLSDMMISFNDFYLKLSGMKNGVNSYRDTEEKEDTGKTDNDGRPIYNVINYSDIQNLVFELYKDKV